MKKVCRSVTSRDHISSDHRAAGQSFQIEPRRKRLPCGDVYHRNARAPIKAPAAVMIAMPIEYQVATNKGESSGQRVA
jgi:hypothetical protein